MRRCVCTEEHVVAALQKRYDSRAWAFLQQVRNGTGYARRPRTADVIAVSLWPSRGLEIHGIEVKVSLPDFERELREPAKADAIQRWCHRWWVAAPGGMIPEADVPPSWGLYVLEKGKIKACKQAPLLDPTPPDMLFLASVLRKASEIQASAVERAYQRGREEGEEKGQSGHRLESEIARVRSEYARLSDCVTRFESASGIQIRHSYHLERTGKLLRSMEKWFAGVGANPTDRVQGMINALRVEMNYLEQAKQAAAELEQISGLEFEHAMPGNKKPTPASDEADG